MSNVQVQAKVKTYRKAIDENVQVKTYTNKEGESHDFVCLLGEIQEVNLGNGWVPYTKEDRGVFLNIRLDDVPGTDFSKPQVANLKAAEDGSGTLFAWMTKIVPVAIATVDSVFGTEQVSVEEGAVIGAGGDDLPF